MVSWQAPHHEGQSPGQDTRAQKQAHSSDAAGKTRGREGDVDRTMARAWLFGAVAVLFSKPAREVSRSVACPLHGR